MSKKLTKAESARINGAKSKGPKTPEGKQRSRLNAIRHGLAARTVCLTKEDRPIFEAVVEAYTNRFQPADDIEEDLIEQMVVAKWKQRRCWAMETAALTLEMHRGRPLVKAQFGEIDEVTRQTIAFMSLSEKDDFLKVLARYESSYRRAYHRALKDLRDLQAERKANLPNEPTEPPESHAKHDDLDEIELPEDVPPPFDGDPDLPEPPKGPSPRKERHGLDLP